MSRVRWAVVAQCALATAAILAAGGPGLLADLHSTDAWVLVVSVALAAALLSSLSVWLPRGDAVDSSAAIAFMAGAYLSPQLSAAVLAVGWLLGMVVSSRGMDLWRSLEQVSRRALLMAGTYASLGFVVRWLLGGSFAPSAVGAATVRLGTLESGLALRTAMTPGFGSSSSVLLLSLAIGVCGALFVALDLLIEQLQSSVRLSSPYGSLLIGSVRLRGWMAVAEMSVATLTVLVYPTLGAWGLAIATGMLIIMRRSFVLLRDMQTSYELTIEVLARSMEWSDSARRGHAERVANMVATAARRIGFSSKRLEDVRYAALFHDVAHMGSDEGSADSESTSSGVLSDVVLLGGALPILRILDSGGHVSESPDEEDVIGAYLISRFSDIDELINVGSAPDSRLSNAIGTRLYASTRTSAERVIADVERVAPSLGSTHKLSVEAAS